MHHYTRNTCSQLPDGDLAQGKNAWSMDLPRLIFESELVLHALLGISALNHWALTPDDQVMSHAAKFYFDKIIPDHRTALSIVDKNTSEAVSATAIIICHHTWILGHSTSDELYEIPLQTYYMTRGIQALFDQMWPWLRGSAYLCYIERQPNPEPTEDFSQTPWMASIQEDLTRLS